MKKSLFVLFGAIILSGFSAKAQTIGSSSLSSDAHMSPNLGGEWSVVILVTDAKSLPVSGATVSLPCSGHANQITSGQGYATFSGSGTCPCSSGTVEVISSKCDIKEAVICGTNDITCD